MADVLYIDNVGGTQKMSSIERRLTNNDISYDLIHGTDYEVEKAFKEYDLSDVNVLIENIYPPLEIYGILQNNSNLKYFKISNVPRLHQFDDADMHWLKHFKIDKERVFVFGYDSLKLFPAMKKALE